MSNITDYNMNNISFLWDLDGTLIDSYKVIASSIEKVLNNKNIFISYEDIRKEVTENAVGHFLEKIAIKYNLSFNELSTESHKLINSRYLEVESIKNAKEILNYLSNQNIKNFIYTHKGKSTFDILNNLNLSKFFTEILTIEDGFKRKPDPEAINYLITKYNMNKNCTYYVGDRKLDIESANNANIKSILYIPENSYVKPTGKENYIIKDLIEIKDILNVSRETSE